MRTIPPTAEVRPGISRSSEVAAAVGHTQDGWGMKSGPLGPVWVVVA